MVYDKKSAEFFLKAIESNMEASFWDGYELGRAVAIRYITLYRERPMDALNHLTDVARSISIYLTASKTDFGPEVMGRYYSDIGNAIGKLFAFVEYAPDILLSDYVYTDARIAIKQLRVMEGTHTTKLMNLLSGIDRAKLDSEKMRRLLELESWL